MDANFDMGEMPPEVVKAIKRRKTKKLVLAVLFLLVSLAVLTFVLIHFLSSDETAPVASRPKPRAETPEKWEDEDPDAVQEVRENYDTGELKAVYFVRVANPSVRHGKYQEFYRSGNLMIETEYVDGKMSGDYAFHYDEKGKTAMRGNVENGQRHGKFVELHVNGNVKSEGEFRDGKLFGVLVEFDAEGNKVLEQKRVDDIMGVADTHFTAEGKPKRSAALADMVEF